MSKRTLIHGIGVNDANYPTQPGVEGEKCLYYVKWKDMLRRCYSETFLKKNPSYRGCTVCNEWIIFSNFKAWMEKQDWEGKELDKGLLILGNRVYSPEACSFVPSYLNCLFLSCRKARGEYMLGVSRYEGDRPTQPYLASIQLGNGVATRCKFYTEIDAHCWWAKKKAEVIRDRLKRYKEGRFSSAVVQALENRILLLELASENKIELSYI